MKKASFTCVIYIHATAEEVWRGLLDPEFTRQYWMHENVSDWEEGSEWSHRRTNDEGTVDIEGHVLESDPPNRLVLSWVQPESKGDPAKTSRVSFEIAPQNDWPHGPWVGLTVLHHDLEPDSEMLHSISFGWPAVVSGLKTVIESPEVFASE